jgi:GNAT superfamily N-acetyltransferase
LIRVLDTSGFKELEYPEELKGSWFYYVFFENHSSLDGIACVYFNDKYPSGSVCVGDYILNDYPDIYATWKKIDEFKNVVADRMLVSPILRKRGIGKSSLYYGAQVLKYMFDKNLVHEYGSEAGNRLYTAAFKDNPVETAAQEESLDLREEFFDQPIEPYVFFGKRASR